MISQGASSTHAEATTTIPSAPWDDTKREHVVYEVTSTYFHIFSRYRVVQEDEESLTHAHTYTYLHIYITTNKGELLAAT